MNQELQTVEDSDIQHPLQVQTIPAGVSPLVSMLASGQIKAENIEQAMRLQRDHEQYEAEKAFNAAMALFRSEVTNVLKDQKGHNSNYASLGAVTRAVTPALTANGFNFKWTDEQDHERKTITVTCHVTHALGHSEKTSLTSNYETSGNKNDIQAIASAKSYLNRYTLSGLLGIATEDDDGQTANAYQPAYTDEQKQYFHGLIKGDRALDLYVFNCTIDESIVTDLFNSFEKGKKTAMKNKFSQLNKQGLEEAQNIGVAITEQFETDNHDAVLEAWSELSARERTVIASQLTGVCRAYCENLEVS